MINVPTIRSNPFIIIYNCIENEKKENTILVNRKTKKNVDAVVLISVVVLLSSNLRPKTNILDKKSSTKVAETRRWLFSEW
jgi:hypothetical protein